MTRFDIVVAVALFATVPASAQTAPSVPATPSPQAAASPNAAAAGPQLVDAAGADGVLALGESITVTLSGLDEWRKAHKDGELILFLDGHPVANLAARPGATAQQVVFHLEWGPEAQREWAAVMSRPQFAPRAVRVQVGAKDQPPFPGAKTLQLTTLSSKWFLLFVVAFALLLTGFLMVARTSDLLREGVVAPPGARRPYSLGRTQMAVWFFVVVAAFIFIWIVTGTYQPLTPSVLGLIGISAGTALGATMIDSNKQAAADNESKSLDGERLRLETEIAALNAAIADIKSRIAAALPGTDVGALQDQLSRSVADLALKKERTLQIQQQFLAIGSAAIPRASRRFLDDILSDENGVSFHRFQIAVWTLVLVIVFGFVVYKTLGMPNFDEKLLALMGLSSGTYLGFKFPESK